VERARLRDGSDMAVNNCQTVKLAQHLRSLYPKAIHLLLGEHEEILGRLEVGQGKSGMLENKSIKIEEKLLWTAYRKSPTIFRVVLSPTPWPLP